MGKEDSERHRLRLTFWTELLEEAKGKLPLFNTISPTKDVWIGKYINRGFCYAFWVTKDSVRAELRINFGKEQDAYSLEVFNILKERQSEIESKYGGQLEWNEAEGCRVCIIRKVFKDGGYINPETEWIKVSNKAIDAMVRLEKATNPLISKINGN